VRGLVVEMSSDDILENRFIKTITFFTITSSIVVSPMLATDTSTQWCRHKGERESEGESGLAQSGKGRTESEGEVGVNAYAYAVCLQGGQLDLFAYIAIDRRIGRVTCTVFKVPFLF
jgi:hypothetical protein